MLSKELKKMKILEGMSDAHKNVLAVFLIVILATIIYSNSFGCSFHFDDQHSIVENYAIHRFDLKKILSSGRPILNLTLALNYHFGKLDVFGYHLVNLSLHIANGIMIYFILLWTLKLPSFRDRYSQRLYKIPLYASLIFISHPIQTQAVTYIISRSSVLATFFYLLSLLLFIKAFQEGSELRTQASKPYLIGALFASCLGMGSKQIAATLPAVLLIYDFYFISNGDWRQLGRHYKIHIAMFCTVGLVVYLSLGGLRTFISFDYAEGVPMPQEAPVTSFHYFLTQLHVIPYYIKLLFLPTNLNLDYDWPITRSVDLLTAVFFILLSAIVILAIILFNRSRLLSFGIIWFFVTLSVTSSFIVIYDVIFEHRLYLPSVGFAIIMALMISNISRLAFWKRAES
jgi:hypothetical protein